MKTGAGVSGAAHLALIGLVVFSGDLFSTPAPPPVNIAEVTMMSGAEFEAAQSAAPDFDATLPPAPEAPNPGDERADVKLSETDAAPTRSEAPETPDAPQRGETVEPPPEPVEQAEVADVGERPAAPPAPEDDKLVASPEPTPEDAPVSRTATAPAPNPRPSAPAVEDATPEAPPVETAEAEPAPQETQEPEPQPEPKAAPERPTPPEPDTLRAEDEEPKEDTPPAPKLAPPPPTKPKELAEAARAARAAREQRQPQETGATRQAEAPSGGGTTRTVGQLSYRDRELLRVGIRGFFSPPTGLQNEDTLAVKIKIEVGRDGRITAGPEVLEPGGRLDGAHDALMRAGVRALKRAEAAGVFAKLPSDRYDRWRVMHVTFTPRKIQFL